LNLSAIAENISRKLASRAPRKAEFTLSQKNIYIIPSQAGFGFILLIILMLLTAINYQNSLIYLFTFFLCALFFISIWLCFLNLNGLRIASYQVLECFEGELCPYSVQLLSVSKPALSLYLGPNKHSLVEANVKKDTKETLSLLMPKTKRGLHALERLRIQSYFPFGFIVAWTWLKLDAKTLVYPEPKEGIRAIGQSSGEAQSAQKLKADDLSDLKHYQHGDSASRILWKQYAAKDQLIVRSNELGGYNSSWLTWQSYEATDSEMKLRHLCFDILDFNRKQQVYGLDIPGVHIAPSSGEQHKRRCLEALALFGSKSGGEHFV